MRNKYLILLKEDGDEISIGFREENSVVNGKVTCNYHLFKELDSDVDIIKETNGYSYIISSLSPKSCVERFSLIYDFLNFNVLHVKHEIKSDTIKLVKINDLRETVLDKLLETRNSFVEEEYLLLNWLKSNLEGEKLENLQYKLKLLDSLIQNDRRSNDKQNEYVVLGMDNLPNVVNEINSNDTALQDIELLDYVIKDLSSLVNSIDDSIMAKLTLINDKQKVNTEDIDNLKLLNMLTRKISTNLTLIKTIKIKSECARKGNFN